MNGKRDKFWGGFEKESALKLRWRQAADWSRGSFRQQATHDRQQWTAVYVGSLDVRITTTGDGSSWKQRHSGCSRKETATPGRAGISKWAQLTWNQCVPETAASVGLAALVWRAHTEKIDVSVWHREPTEVGMLTSLDRDETHVTKSKAFTHSSYRSYYKHHIKL